jgi:L-threonylcarbamoyladenylate synthase
MATIGTDPAHAAQLLRQGHIVAIPTGTVHGLAANAFDEAVRG